MTGMNKTLSRLLSAMTFAVVFMRKNKASHPQIKNKAGEINDIGGIVPVAENP